MAEERNRDADARYFLNAVHIGDKEKMVELLRHGIDVNARGYVEGDHIPSFPLFEAAKLDPYGIAHGTIHVKHEKKPLIGMELIDLLLDNGAKIDQQNIRAHTALSMASSIGNRGAVFKLLERGANPNIGPTKPLIDAIRRNDLILVKKIIEHGARLDIRTYDYDTPARAVVETGNLEITNYLLKHAVRIGSIDFINSLMMNGVDFSPLTPEEKISVLRLALRHSKTDLIRYLVENGVDLASLTREERQQYAFLRRRHLLAGYGYARRSRKQRKANRNTRRRRT